MGFVYFISLWSLYAEHNAHTNTFFTVNHSAAALSRTHTHTPAPVLRSTSGRGSSRRLTAALTYSGFLITKLPLRKLLRYLTDKTDTEGTKRLVVPYQEDCFQRAHRQAGVGVRCGGGVLLDPTVLLL